MGEKRYYWLKLKEDFFSSKRIKRLRNLAGGDTYTIIYLKMQLKALKTDGFLYFDGLLGTFADELALDIDESPDNVKVTVSYLLSCGLLETNDDAAYKLTYMDNVIGSETAHTQRQRDYVARQKERQASLNDGKASFCDESVTRMLRDGDAEKEIEKEKELDKEKEPPFNPPVGETIEIPFSGELREAFDDWLAYKKEKRQPYKDRGLKSLITQTKNYASKYGDKNVADVIRDSMASNYQGITFERLSKLKPIAQPKQYTTKGSFFDE